MTLLALPGELAITIANGQVWLSIGLGLLCGAACLAFGTWVARLVGLLDANAPAGETLGVGLASGLMVVAAWWAAIWSGGQSSFTPVAIGFAIAIGLALVTRIRRPKPVATSSVATDLPDRRRSLALTLLGAAVFIVAIALLYGATMAPSPRDGVQPVEFMDEAFYSILGRDLAITGTETNILPSGFDTLPGVSGQTWYHWGELWLSAAAITVFGSEPIAARNFVVLPILLLAVAALTGTLVRRMAGSNSRRAYLFGFVACLFLAPVPFPVTFFSSWATGMIFGITHYGLAAVAVLLAMYGLVVLARRGPSWALAGFAGSAAAMILPAHVLLAVLALLGVGSVWMLRIAQAGLRRRPLAVAPIWSQTIGVTAVLLAASLIWGQLTGHSLGGTALSAGISPFNPYWIVSTALVFLGGGLFYAIPIAWHQARSVAPLLTDIYLGTMIVVVVSAVAWGARLADFNMFHAFFGGLAVIATPVAAVAIRSVWKRARASGRPRLALVLAVLCLLQVEWGVVTAMFRLQQFGAHDEAPIAVSLLNTIRALPPDAKLAYACRPLDEVAFTDPRLVSIDAHTGRRIVPMCYQADFFSTLTGGPKPTTLPSASFQWAPQRTLYPDAAARPSSAAVTAFMREHGIEYIFADERHPNILVLDAVPLAESGNAAVLQVP